MYLFIYLLVYHSILVTKLVTSTYKWNNYFLNTIMTIWLNAVITELDTIKGNVCLFVCIFVFWFFLGFCLGFFWGGGVYMIYIIPLFPYLLIRPPHARGHCPNSSSLPDICCYIDLRGCYITNCERETQVILCFWK